MLKGKFMHGSNHRTLQIITLLSHTHNTQLHFSLYNFNWNTPAGGHKQGTVESPQRKRLSRSTAKSPVIISRWDDNDKLDLKEIKWEI
jgi:hypothetical protein